VKNRKFIYTLISLVFALGFYIYDNFKNKSYSDFTPNKTLEQYLPNSTSQEIIHHNYYALSYKEKYEQAEWVAYELTDKEISYNDFKRPYFEIDKKVPTKSASYRDYKNSGYNKGHLCPAADRKFSKKAFTETFLMSNVSPQSYEFNSGIWNRLEKRVRYWAKKRKKLIVITGGILKSNLKTIGKNRVAVPQYFYKIIADVHNPKKINTIAFIIPQEKHNLPLYKYTTSIDAIEGLTGIDFFYKLPESVQNKIEKKSSYFNWTFNH
jgi:endonuclease G